MRVVDRKFTFNRSLLNLNNLQCLKPFNGKNKQTKKELYRKECEFKSWLSKTVCLGTLLDNKAEHPRSANSLAHTREYALFLNLSSLVERAKRCLPRNFVLYTITRWRLPPPFIYSKSSCMFLKAPRRIVNGNEFRKQRTDISGVIA